ncbi:type I-A CRISPR-associated protein Cas4/Csa1 [Archaeoglobus sp.]
MFFLDPIEVEKRIRKMRKCLEMFRISEELRGYNWDTPPVEPPSDNLRLSISDFFGFCESMRDIYLKYVEGVKPIPNKYMLAGLAYHEVFQETFRTVKRMLYQEPVSGAEILENLLDSDLPDKICERLGVEDCREKCRALFKYILIQCAASIDRIGSKYPYADSDCLVAKAIPPVIEKKVDGSLLGLSNNLSIDFFVPYNAIADLKSGQKSEKHAVALAGYALAIESDECIDVNYGFIVYLRFRGKFVSFEVDNVFLGDEVRREFLEIRDEFFEIIESGKDPGKPKSCSKNCAYYGVCNEADY